MTRPATTAPECAATLMLRIVAEIEGYAEDCPHAACRRAGCCRGDLACLPTPPGPLREELFKPNLEILGGLCGPEVRDAPESTYAPARRLRAHLTAAPFDRELWGLDPLAPDPLAPDPVTPDPVTSAASGPPAPPAPAPRTAPRRRRGARG